MEGKSAFAKITTTFENVDISTEELGRLVNCGHAFCGQHKNKRKASANFTCAGFLAVDIDHGLSLEQAQENEFVQRCAAILYTTPSHTPEHHRFRIVFELERDITDAEEMKNAYRGISKKFGGDPSCTDACRMFYGSKDSNPILLGNKLPNNELKELIQLGKEATNQHDTIKHDGSKQRSVLRSSRTLDEDDPVQDADGNWHKLGDLNPGVSVYCPVHADHHPSAHTVESRHGVLGVHCSTCAVTYFVSNDMPSVDFNYDLRNLDEKYVEYVGPSDNEPLIEVEIAKAQRDNQRYLDLPDFKAQVIFIKSPKGTGKTEYLVEVVRKCKEARKSVLLIGHRRSLILASAKRLGLQPYITFIHDANGKKMLERIDFNDPTNYYAICADSLSSLLKPDRHKYDVVLIDEIEQVLAHITGDTVKDKRHATFLWFRHYLDCNKQLYVLDADLNQLTVNSVCDLLEEARLIKEEREKKKRKKENENEEEYKEAVKTYEFIINDWKDQGREIALYGNKNHLKDELIASLQHGEKCFVCSNSKTQINQLTRYIETKFGKRKRVVAITSENSDTSGIQDFIARINTEILNYDVVLASPSVGTGVDITFPDSASLIDCVYGFFEARINTHFDIDQQISRVRNPKQIKVWISPQKFNFETETEVVKREIKDSDHSMMVLLDINPDGTLKHQETDTYLNLYANVVTMNRASKNNLRYHFMKLKEFNGWKVIEVEKDEEAAERGKEINRKGKELQEQDRITGILAAKLITQQEYDILEQRKEREALSADEEHAMRRYEIESFYLEDVSEDLIKMDDDGYFRKCVRNYERFYGSDDDLARMDRIERKNKRNIPDRKQRLLWRKMLQDIYHSAGLLGADKRIRTDVVIEGDSLDRFVVHCCKHKVKIENIYDIPVRRDIGKKPAQQLGKFINLLGLSLVRQKTKKKGDTKVYCYSVPVLQVERLDAIKAKRDKPELSKRWHKQRENTADNRLFGRDNPLETEFQSVKREFRSR